jgi:hypothetical protein
MMLSTANADAGPDPDDPCVTNPYGGLCNEPNASYYPTVVSSASSTGTDNADIGVLVHDDDATPVRARVIVKKDSVVITDDYTDYVPSDEIANLHIPNLPVGVYTFEAWASDGPSRFSVASTTGSFKLIEDDPSTFDCVAATNPAERCLVVKYMTPTEVDPFEHDDLSVAAVGQAIENGDLDGAAAFVEERAATRNDPIQDKIETFVEDGLPEDSASDPEIHPDLNLNNADSAVEQGFFAAALNKTFTSTTVRFENWAAQKASKCGCGSTQKRSKAQTKIAMKSTTYIDLGLDVTLEVMAGPAINVTQSRCRLRREVFLSDSTVSTWPKYCDWINTTGPRMSIDPPNSEKKFGGLPNEEYHNDFRARIDPVGSAYDSQETNFKGETFKYDSKGRSPGFYH